MLSSLGPSAGDTHGSCHQTALPPSQGRRRRALTFLAVVRILQSAGETGAGVRRLGEHALGERLQTVDVDHGRGDGDDDTQHRRNQTAETGQLYLTGDEEREVTI